MPQFFEFQFNPPKQNEVAQGKKDLIFDSFCFAPKNVYEKKLGNLCIIGFLKNTLPQNARFLEVLSQQIKEAYYKTGQATPEKSLKESLKLANEHLEKIVKAGDVSWLGNLSFAVIALKNFELNFAKVGDLKLFLIRKGQIIDINQKIKLEEIEPYPLKIFGGIISAKLAENDLVLVLNEQVYDFFLKEKLLNEIAEKSLSALSSEELKKLKNILNGKKEELAKISGSCLLIALSKEEATNEKEVIAREKYLKVFSFREALGPLFVIKNKIFLKLKKSLELSQKKLELPKTTVLVSRVPKISLPKTKGISFAFFSNKKIALILLLLIFLFLGFFIFEKREEKRIKNYQLQIEQIQEKTGQAQSFLELADHNLQAKKNAHLLYKDAWTEILALDDISSSLPPVIASQVFEIKQDIVKNLSQLNNLVEILGPEPVFEFQTREFIPQRLISFKDRIYFFSPLTENIFELDQQGRGKIMPAGKKFNSAALFQNGIIFFSKPNQIAILKEGKLSETISLEEFSPDFISFASYLSHLYFLDGKTNAIVRYPFAANLKWQSPAPWLSPETKTEAVFKSMAIDSSVWLLTGQNKIERYYLGRFEQTINLEIFPEPKNFSKIFTSANHSYLYILEPAQKRIIILDKKGEVIKQFQSKKFDNLLDFSVSLNEKTLWLLNGQKVYQIEIK